MFWVLDDLGLFVQKYRDTLTFEVRESVITLKLGLSNYLITNNEYSKCASLNL